MQINKKQCDFLTQFQQNFNTIMGVLFSQYIKISCDYDVILFRKSKEKKICKHYCVTLQITILL